MVQATQTVELKPETLQAYAKHIGEAEAVVEQALRGDRQFLWSDGSPQRIAQLREGATIAELSSGKRPIQVSDGLIHDWIGATCVPDTTMERTLALVQDYDNHKNVYQPEVIGSRLIRRKGDDFQIYLRLRKKKSLPSFWTPITMCTTSLWTTHAGAATPAPRGFPKWKMRASLQREPGCPTQDTDFCGGSIPTGDSRRETTPYSSSAVQSP